MKYFVEIACGICKPQNKQFMQPQTAVVIGATGMVGSLVVEGLLTDPLFKKVRLLVRRPIEEQHEKLETAIVDFDDRIDLANKMGTGHSIFCCVGTTEKKVKGDKAAYRKVDFDIPFKAAQIAADAGFSKYLLVSSAGADAASTNFYLQLKGEVEKAIDMEKLDSVHIFRPGFLLGNRKEFRPGEFAGKYLMKAFSFLMKGKLSKYKAIEAKTVAYAMIAASKSLNPGSYIYHNRDMISMAE
jgi:uncharacterized protein YbjT (DUF2867 family)